MPSKRPLDFFFETLILVSPLFSRGRFFLFFFFEIVTGSLVPSHVQTLFSTVATVGVMPSNTTFPAVKLQEVQDGTPIFENFRKNPKLRLHEYHWVGTGDWGVWCRMRD